MKYYVQMITIAASYTQELDQPQEIEKEEFTQENVNDWCESYIVDNYGSDEDEQKESGAPDIEYLGFVLTDEEGNKIETLLHSTMARISIDNGHSFVTAAEALEVFGIDDIAQMMDDDTREQIHGEIAGQCTDEEFLEEYLRRAPEDLIIG